VRYIHDGYLKLPHSLLVLLRAPRVLKVAVHVKADLTRLFNDCGFSTVVDAPFAGAVELGYLAYHKNISHRANVSLADLASLVLHRSLLKDPSIRVSTDWDNPELSSAQVRYASLDVYASWAIYESLIHEHVGGLVTHSTNGGTPVKLLSRDHSTPVAYGFIASDRPAKFDGVNVTSTRVIVNITVLKVPAYLVRGELMKSRLDTPLSSLASGLPFELLCLTRDLRTCTNEELQHARSSVSPPLLPIQPALHQATPSDPDIPDLVEHSEEEGMDEEPWTNGASYDPHLEQHVEGSTSDSRAAHHAQALEKLSRLPQPTTLIRSRVLGDIYHLMAMFKISIHHGIRRPFSRALRDALFLVDPDDKAAVAHVLAGKSITFDQMVLWNSDWVWKRVKRVVPPPEVLLPRVTQVFKVYGPLQDATTGLPLFNEASWDKARNILENIRMGYYSDPPNISLYIVQGRDSEGLTLYNCLRGTNNVEGSVHRNIV
jgi:hypothetical protein